MCFAPATARATDKCALIESRSSLPTLSGAHITSVDVVSGGPELPGPVARFAAFHTNSRASVIRRQLLFAPGDTIDTLLVAETLRRLRAQRLFGDAAITAQRCDADGGVALSIHTRDTWTLRPTARLQSTNQLSVGVEEKNFLGTGRAVSLTREYTLRGNGAAVSLVDPFLFGRDLTGNVRLANLAGGHTLRFGVRRHEYSVFDGWKAEANFARLSYGDTIVGERALHTITAAGLLGKQIARSPAGVSMVLAGFDFDSAASISPSMRQVAPGQPHVRSYLGLDLGFQRRTAEFDSAGWIAPGRGFLDVPLGWESEVLVGAGYERAAEEPAMKIDGWLGRVFMPRHGSIVMVDGWASSYFGREIDRNQIVRGALSWYQQAARGMWGVRLTAEELLELDPDRRNLSLMALADYTAPVLRPYVARGGQSVTGSLGRDIRLFTVGANSVVNVGPWVAGSYRWSVDNAPGNQVKAGVVGGRLRILSANGAISSIRLDFGYPVIRSAFLNRSPFVTITYGALFDVSRQRDGRRLF